MSVIVFAGPTLHGIDTPLPPNCELRPPAARGDVLEASYASPSAIAIVDGYFDGTPSVWHKEILWALSSGISVLGAASMGALRAAELAPFGMVGVGWIFEQFATGQLEDDDEVAVAHASAEHGFRPLSEAMVNIRATTHAAHAGGVLDAAARDALNSAAKALPYAERHYVTVLRAAEERGVSPSVVSTFRDWLTLGRVDQKGADARALFRVVSSEDLPRPTPPREFSFSHTDAWESLRTSVEDPRKRVEPAAASFEDLLDELCASGELPQVFVHALVRSLALDLGERHGIDLNAVAVNAVAEDFRREQGLADGETFATWLARQDLQGQDVGAFFLREATVRAVSAAEAHRLKASILDHLRASGSYAEVSRRAAMRAELVGVHGLNQATTEDTGLSEAELWEWFFARTGTSRAVFSNCLRGALLDEDRLRRVAVQTFLCERRKNSTKSRSDGINP